MRVYVCTSVYVRTHARTHTDRQTDTDTHRGDVEAADLLVGEGVEVLDERAQRVAVRCYQHLLACLHRWDAYLRVREWRERVHVRERERERFYISIYTSVYIRI